MKDIPFKVPPGVGALFRSSEDLAHPNAHFLQFLCGRFRFTYMCTDPAGFDGFNCGQMDAYIHAHSACRLDSLNLPNGCSMAAQWLLQMDGRAPIAPQKAAQPPPPLSMIQTFLKSSIARIR